MCVLPKKSRKLETAQEAEGVQEGSGRSPSDRLDRKQGEGRAGGETPESTGSRTSPAAAGQVRQSLAVLFNILAKDHLSESDWEDVEDTLLLLTSAPRPANSWLRNQ